MEGANVLRSRTPAVATALEFGATGVRLAVPDKAVRAAQESVEKLIGDPMSSASAKPGGSIRMQFGEWSKAIIWAPFHMPNYRFQKVPYLITLFTCFMLATVTGVAITVVASYATSTSVALNASPVAVVTFVVILVGMSMRADDHLPQLMHPALVFAEWVHGHIGVVVAGPMLVMMAAGAALCAPILTGLGGTFLPDYATAGRPISYWGAMALQTTLVAFVVYMYQYNTAVKHYHLGQSRPRKSSIAAFKKPSIFFAAANYLSVFIGFGNGLYSVGSFVVTLGSYINKGSWNMPDTAACTLDLAWPFVGALVGWLLHLLTWNVKGLTMDEMAEAADEEEAVEAL